MADSGFYHEQWQREQAAWDFRAMQEGKKAAAQRKKEKKAAILKGISLLALIALMRLFLQSVW